MTVERIKKHLLKCSEFYPNDNKYYRDTKAGELAKRILEDKHIVMSKTSSCPRLQQILGHPFLQNHHMA